MTLVCYQPLPLSWEGRKDGDDPLSLRWHQKIKAVDISRETLPALQQGQKGIALLGFVSDEGVRRNKGRTGAAAAPAMIRKMCANFPVHFDEQVLVDAGNIVCEGQQLETAQEALSATVNYILKEGYLPVLLGGGHEIAYPHERGIRHFTGNTEQLGIINFDAHFDLREPDENGPSSGTGFFQIAQDRAAENMPFHYLALGIQQNSNTRKLFQTAETLGAEHLQASLFQLKYRDQLLGAIQAFIKRTDKIYLTTCMDVFASPYAPGVSATAYNGLVPDALFLDCYRTVLRSGKLAGTDIAEVNPSFDQDNRTAKLAASLVYEIVMNYFAV